MKYDWSIQSVRLTHWQSAGTLFFVANIRLKIRNEFVMKEMDPVTAKALLKRHLKDTKELISENEFEQLAFRKNLMRESGELTKLGWKLAKVTESDDRLLDF